MPPESQKVRIKIPNWRKYQRGLKSGQSRRQWVAFSIGLPHDPDFFRLTIEQRYLWMMLLLHAGAVGVEYEWGTSDVGVMFDLCPSDARVLFKLRRSADFQPLINQGFIEIEGRTLQDRTGQDIPVGAKPSAPPKNQSRKKEKSPDESMIWDTGLAYLNSQVGNDRENRSFLGGQIKSHGKEAVAKAVAAMVINKPVSGGEYLIACLQNRPENQSNFDQQNKNLKDWLDGQPH